jgi:lysozyme
MMINKAGIDLIKEFEGFKSEAYLDTLAKPALWTIGYGTTERAGVGIVPRAGMKITEKQATEYLQKAVDKFAGQVLAVLKRPATDNQLAAMVSLAYNIGPSAFARSSVLKRFNEGKFQAAADAFLLWNKAGGKVLRGLERRRARERELFLMADSVVSEPAPKSNWIVDLINALVAIFGKRK